MEAGHEGDWRRDWAHPAESCTHNWHKTTFSRAHRLWLHILCYKTLQMLVQWTGMHKSMPMQRLQKPTHFGRATQLSLEIPLCAWETIVLFPWRHVACHTQWSRSDKSFLIMLHTHYCAIITCSLLKREDLTSVMHKRLCIMLYYGIWHCSCVLKSQSCCVLKVHN